MLVYGKALRLHVLIKVQNVFVFILVFRCCSQLPLSDRPHHKQSHSNRRSITESKPTLKFMSLLSLISPTYLISCGEALSDYLGVIRAEKARGGESNHLSRTELDIYRDLTADVGVFHHGEHGKERGRDRGREGSKHTLDTQW